MATILGPPLAAGMVVVFGPQTAIICIGLPYGLAALALAGVREPISRTVSSGRLLVDALEGVRYAWGNRTIRGLGFAIASLNLAGGIASIVIPLLVLDRLGGSELMVGLAFAVSGVAGMSSVLLFGRMDSRGKEWRLLVYPMMLTGPATGLLLVANSGLGVDMPLLGFAILGISMLLIGLLSGPLDIALFTIRQRRTDPAWMGRAFAISMAINFSGFPIGAGPGHHRGDRGLWCSRLLRGGHGAQARSGDRVSRRPEDGPARGGRRLGRLRACRAPSGGARPGLDDRGTLTGTCGQVISRCGGV